MGMITENLARVRERVFESALRADRSPDEVRLVAITKTVGVEAIKEAIAGGVTICGENYVQEGRSKIAKIGGTVAWHLVGRLQTNKARHAVSLFSLVHSLDSVDLAQALDRYAAELNRTMDVLIQVNLAGETSKAGVAPDELERVLEQTSLLKNIQVRGLMTMPPYFTDPERARPLFRALRLMRDRVLPRLPASVSLEHLSMGMSGDFETAIEEGATLVRVGSAIFGVRT